MEVDDPNPEEEDVLMEEEEEEDQLSNDEVLALNSRYEEKKSELQMPINMRRGMRRFDVCYDMVEIAYELNDSGKLHESLQLISRAGVPLSADVWLAHMKFAVSLTSSEQDIGRIIELFKRATEDYQSIYSALELASLVKLTNCQNAQAQEIWSLLIPLYGYDFTRGREIWSAYRDDIMRREPDTPDRVGKIFDTFRQELGVPLRNLQVAFGEFEIFFAAHGSVFPNVDVNFVRADIQRKIHFAASCEPFEAQLDVVREAIHLNESNELINEARKGLTRVGLENNYVSIYCKYIAHCTDSQFIPPEGIVNLYERVITACPAYETPWKTYLAFLFNLIASGYRSSHNFGKDIFDVIERGLRQSRPIQHAVQSAILNALIHCNMTPQVNFSEILRNARTSNGSDGEKLFADIIMAYLAYLFTSIHTDENERQFENVSDMSYQFFVTIYGRNEENARPLWVSAIDRHFSE